MKLLIHKEKREVVDGREFVVSKAKQYLVSSDKDVDTFYGVVSKSDLQKSGIIKSSSNKEFIVLDAGFIDIYKRLRKLPQTIPLKDIGLIMAETSINKDSLVVDGGVGSAALASALANIVKKVVSYEVREDCIAVSKDNINSLNIKNIEIKHKSLYDGIDEKDVDLITLDVPEPWKVIPHAVKALKVGGFLVSYSPCVPQVMDFANEVRNCDSLLFMKCVELIERLWDVAGRKVRPKSTGIGHSGFLTFVRKIKD